MNCVLFAIEPPLPSWSGPVELQRTYPTRLAPRIGAIALQRALSCRLLLSQQLTWFIGATEPRTRLFVQLKQQLTLFYRHH